MSSAALQFKKAVKHDARGRVALIGPAGSGKSYTMLKLARLLAGPAGKIAAVDTEHGSLSKYADLFEFDVIELASFTPDNFLNALDAAEENRYDVFCCDSLSHFWMGKDGALEFVDERGKRKGGQADTFAGWKDWRPHERAMIDRMIASPCHVITTMRTKTDYVEEVNEKTGKKQRRKIGLAPVQREGLEFEMDLVGYMDDDNTLIVDKTRCPHYSGKAITKPGEKDLLPFKEWLKGAKREPAIASGQGSVQGAESRPAAPAPAPSNGSTWDWRTVLVPFEAIEKTIGTEAYVRLLGAEGFTDLSELPDRETAKRVYKNLWAAAAQLPAQENAQPLQPGHAAVAEPVKRTPIQETQHATMPAELEALWARVFDIKSACTVLGELKKELYELAGEERGHQFYYTALAEFGASHANDFKRNLGKARQCASRIWERIQLIKNPPAHNPEITDDDVPKGDPEGVLAEAQQAKDGLLFEHEAFREYGD